MFGSNDYIVENQHERYCMKQYYIVNLHKQLLSFSQFLFKLTMQLLRAPHVAKYSAMLERIRISLYGIFLL